MNPVLVLPPLKSPEVNAAPVMRALPALVELNATVQVAVPTVVPVDNRHGLPVNEAPELMPVWLKATLPVGVSSGVPGEASVTVTVQVEDAAVVTVDGVHVTVVLVGR